MNGAPLKAAAFIFGLALIAIAVIAWRPAAAPAGVGFELNVSALPTGEVGVSVADSLYKREIFAGGAPAHGEISVDNQTGRRLGVSVQSTPGDPWAGRAVQVRIDAGSTQLFEGTLGRLWSQGSDTLTLGPGATRRLEMEAWLPESTPPGWRGAVERVELQMRSETPAARSRG